MDTCLGLSFCHVTVIFHKAYIHYLCVLSQVLRVGLSDRYVAVLRVCVEIQNVCQMPCV